MTVNKKIYEKFNGVSVKKHHYPVVVFQKNESNVDGTAKKRLIIDFKKLNSVNIKYSTQGNQIFK